MDRVLVDTSIWIELFRSASKAGDELERLLKEDTVWTCGIVVFELLQGVKSEREKSVIMDALLNLEYIEMSWLHWQKAADLSIKIKKKGLALPLSDLFIASITIEHDLQIFTLDKHFKKIPGVKLYRF
ncbi:hypothetical protein MNBD_NITROSPIRAE02-237 [hydrothermal vent metagenome]|uniref:PIN domain-containing protein n=1 Tax=hydrothermal vent metagenome TaxID=652676 RepID=A0A3B1CEL5_9ZZZZ